MKILHKSRTIRRPCFIITVFFLSFFPGVRAQQIHPDARSIALGSIASLGDFSASPLLNPALLGEIESVQFMGGHSMPFFIKEIGISSLQILIPVFPGAFRLGLSGYGLKGFRYFSYSLDYGMPLGERLQAGINFNFQHLAASGDISYLWNTGLGAGCIYKISELTKIAVILINPVQIGNYPDYGELFPSMIALGISKSIYQHTLAMAELAFDSLHGLQCKIGLCYRPMDEILLRLGYHTSPHALSAGIAYCFGRIGLDLAISWGTLPGITPAFLISYML